MKKVIPLVGIVLMVAGLTELLDLTFYLMNQSDTFVFNLGLISLACIFIAFGFLGMYTYKYLSTFKEEEKEEIEQNKNN
jgi:membrane-bound ClpP family serine protease